MLTLVCTFSNGENDCQTFIIAIILCVAFTKTSGVHARRVARCWLGGARVHRGIGESASTTTSNFIRTKPRDNLDHLWRFEIQFLFFFFVYFSSVKPCERTQAVQCQLQREHRAGLLSPLTCSLNAINKRRFLLNCEICKCWQRFSVCVYMSRNFLLLVAVSLLSTER